MATPRSLTLRTALFLGFGLTFGIWLLVGYYFSRRISDVESRAAAINARYVQAQERLSSVRAQVLLASVYVRDALLDPDPSSVDTYRTQLDDIYRLADQTLEHYVPVLDSSAERQRVARLRSEIAEFRGTMLQILESEGSHWPRDARTLLRTLIVPKREIVIRVSEEVQALNRSAFVQQQAGISEVYGVTQRRVWAALGFALAASVGIGLLATVYAGRLEDRIRRQQLRDVRNARELQHLSAKLITAQEEERRTISRELHDEVGQVLTAIKVELAVAQRAVDANGGPAHLLNDARAITDGALATVRNLSHLLHPALLDDLGLAAAVDWYLREFGRRHGVRVELIHDGTDERLTPELETSAYRILQEALTNVARHARATACRVYLQRLSNTMLLTIEDDGVGFDVAALQHSGERHGLGLIGIRERVTEVGGTMRLESTPGKGARLTVELPARPRIVADDPAADSRGVHFVPEPIDG